MEKNDEFLKLYNELDALISEKYDRYEDDSSIYFLINKFKKSDIKIERDYSKKLDSIRKIRNIYVHESGVIDSLFDVSDDVILILKEIYNYLDKPILAKDIMTTFNNLKIGTLDSNIKDLLDVIYEFGVSNIPIIEDEKVIGIFNSDVVMNIYYKEKAFPFNSKIKDIAKYIDFSENQNTRFIFVNERFEATILNEYFSLSKEKYNKRLPLIFVTDSGKKDGKLLGVITPLDLFKKKEK